MRDGRNERIDDPEPIFGRLGGERFGQSLAPEVLPVLRTIIGNEVGLVGFDPEALHPGSDAGESIWRPRAVPPGSPGLFTLPEDWITLAYEVDEITNGRATSITPIPK